ncbi:flagellar filament capping protein FliD [Paracandidimonas soli]|uniref:Flagellar hook-associated protein 2 n=1 Tax=Paracandidimonas soli TaxID=1917182 RepID=A0A4R3VDN4_9BURK|nr:flagellar filament capping protein FliD [Paracandidimonas soli]TCV00835.1 flagellar hook-associated protein 2 [Paracandidimonas soli]
MAISSIGVGSGLPIEQILSDLRKSENVALELVQNRQIQETNRFSAYGTIKSALEAFKNAAEQLGKPGTIGAMKSSSNSEAIGVSTSEKAIAGQYRLTVNTLASAQSLTTQGQADRTSNIGSGGSISITLGDGTVQTLDLSGKGTSLNDLVKAINADDKLGVSATIINDGSDAPFRLMLTSRTTGTDAAVTEISVSGNSELQGLIGFSSGGTHSLTEQAAVNASVYVNGSPENGGIAITSQSNQLDDVIEGVKLTLTKASADPVTITVSRDDTAATTAVNAFVKAYNSLQTTIRNLTTYDTEAQKGSALTGDSLARRVQSQMREAIGFSTDSGAMRSLSDLGIVTDDYTIGTLKVDSEKLEKALKENLGDITNLFVGDKSLTKAITNAADPFLRSDGYIASAQEGSTEALKRLEKQFQSTSERIDATIEAYRQQFIGLDKTLAQMNSLSTYLTQQLSMLSNLGKESSK